MPEWFWHKIFHCWGPWFANGRGNMQRNCEQCDRTQEVY